MQPIHPMLAGKKALIIGIANEHSIAYGCAKAFRAAGCELAITYLNDKAKPYVDPLAAELTPSIYLPCDVTDEAQLAEVFSAMERQWGTVDIVLHSIAFAPKNDLHGRLTDSSREGFLQAMDISCHSFTRMARLAEPLMKNGGALLTMSYYGSEKVIPHYNLMGPVKAALESSVRYLAAELGSKRIRVLAISPGPLKTRAASGLDRFDELLAKAAKKAPLHQIVDIDDIGSATCFFASDQARHITGETIYIDAGYHIMG
jgi:enoyl-[acyl-carrier protein] reductase I